jgi:nucleotide-binding universal stress UspA family protein
MTDQPKAPILLACLDLTGIDEQIIRFTRGCLAFYPEAKVRFMHVVQEYDLPSRHSDPEKTNAERRKIIRALQKDLLEKISPCFPDIGREDLLFPVAGEDAAEEIVETARKVDASILIVGEKEGRKRSHWYSRRIAATADCQIIIVPDCGPAIPESPPDEIRAPCKTILLATDFSQAADPALAFALRVSRETGIRLGLHRVRDTSRSFFPFLKGHQAGASADKTRELAREAMKRIQAGETSIAFFTARDEDPHQSEAQRLLAVAESYEADLIIFSARGEGDSLSTPFGNMIEALGKSEKRIPILFHRQPTAS